MRISSSLSADGAGRCKGGTGSSLVIVADSNGAEILREAQNRRMSLANRGALLLRFAQADRLQRLA